MSKLKDRRWSSHPDQLVTLDEAKRLARLAAGELIDKLVELGWHATLLKDKTERQNKELRIVQKKLNQHNQELQLAKPQVDLKGGN